MPKKGSRKGSRKGSKKVSLKQLMAKPRVGGCGCNTPLIGGCGCGKSKDIVGHLIGGKKSRKSKKSRKTKKNLCGGKKKTTTETKHKKGLSPALMAYRSFQDHVQKALGAKGGKAIMQIAGLYYKEVKAKNPNLDTAKLAEKAKEHFNANKGEAKKKYDALVAEIEAKKKH